MRSSFIAVPLLAAALLAANAFGGNADLYSKRTLVSNTASIPAENTDPNLVNAWGIAFNPYGFVWVADEGSGKSTLYDGDGKPQSLVVLIPAATTSDEKTGEPTGIVFYGGPAFLVTKGSASGPARFIFAGEDGAISAWAPNVDLTHAVRMAETPGAIYKGLAISGNGDKNLIYATDFFNAKVDVFDSDFKPVNLGPDAFRDPRIPAGYAPFGIQAIAGDIYVTYAKQDEEKEDDVPGRGFGFVDVYSPQGTLLRRLISRGALNAPWGMALAPAGFGKFANRLLVGNFGDGRINAYNLDNGHFVGTLRGADHRPIRIDGLWGLAFGNGVSKQPVDTLFFTAGPNDEENGVYGRIDVAPGEDHDEGAVNE